MMWSDGERWWSYRGVAGISWWLKVVGGVTYSFLLYPRGWWSFPTVCATSELLGVICSFQLNCAAPDSD